MPRLTQTNRPIIALTDAGNPPAEVSLSEADNGVPDSFAEWLAQPSCPIEAGPELAQGIFVGLLAECQAQIPAGLSVKTIRH